MKFLGLIVIAFSFWLTGSLIHTDAYWVIFIVPVILFISGINLIKDENKNIYLSRENNFVKESEDILDFKLELDDDKELISQHKSNDNLTFKIQAFNKLQKEKRIRNARLEYEEEKQRILEHKKLLESIENEFESFSDDRLDSLWKEKDFLDLNEDEIFVLRKVVRARKGIDQKYSVIPDMRYCPQCLMVGGNCVCSSPEQKRIA